MKNPTLYALGLVLPLLTSALAAEPTRATFTGRFATKTHLYELTQSFTYPGDSIAPSLVEKGMECVSQSGDGCDQEGCVARLYFDLSEKRLRIRDPENNQTIVDLPSSSKLQVWLPQENCRDLRVDIPPNFSVLAEVSDRFTDFELEGHPIGGWMLFSGHGTLVQDPASGAIRLRGFRFDDDQSYSLHIEDSVCLNGPSIFEENCRARFLNGLKGNSPGKIPPAP